jgi:hypothetical protein
MQSILPVCFINEEHLAQRLLKHLARLASRLTDIPSHKVTCMQGGGWLLFSDDHVAE